jgi:hypothetical protein
MKNEKINSIIKQILMEIFINSFNIKDIEPNANITIFFQDNNIKLEKTSEEKFKVLDIKNSEKVQVGDEISFLEKELKVGNKTKCYIFRKNESGKMLKIDFIHQFSPIKSIEIL